MAILAQEIIRKKRDGGILSKQEICDLVDGITHGSISDAQISAFTMAVFFQSLNTDETVHLTLAMRDSGDVLQWPTLNKPAVDKHSTGGVGDNVSLMLAPMAAACGLDVPMISGRGLGHTGGTLDKMDSIPGYNSHPDNKLFVETVEKTGCAIIGQTANLAPADKRIYAVRDVTATVENLSLITASILSKKLAAGLGWLVLDIKYGNGAFMQKIDDARALAKSLVHVANGAGTKTIALLTDMNEPLASAVGNAVEVTNAVEFLIGKRRDPRLETVTIALVSEMIACAYNRNDRSAIEQMVRSKLNDGTAAALFGKMIKALGGPEDFVVNYETYLPSAAIIEDVVAPESGYIDAVSTRDIGMAVVEMGGGRYHNNDRIDYSVGLSNLVSIGTQIQKGDRLFTLHAQNRDMANTMRQKVLDAYKFISKEPPERAIIAEKII